MYEKVLPMPIFLTSLEVDADVILLSRKECGAYVYSSFSFREESIAVIVAFLVGYSEWG